MRSVLGVSAEPEPVALDSEMERPFMVSSETTGGKTEKN